MHTCAPPLLTSLAAMTRLSVLSLFIALGRLSKHMMQCVRQYPGNSISLAWIPDFQHDKEGEVLWPPGVSQNGRFFVDLNVLMESVGSIGMSLLTQFGRYQSSSSLKERDI